MTKPDYSYLIKLDSWTKKDASLIISGLNPDDYRKVRLTGKDLDFNLNPELRQPCLLYKLFLATDFYEYGRRHNHPLTYICECLFKDWPVPDELREFAQVRYIRETGKSLPSFEAHNVDENTSENITKEKSYLLKTIAIIVQLYVSKLNLPRLGTAEKINVSQVTEDILQFLENQNLQIYGIGKSSLNRRIAEGIRLLFRDNL